MSHLEPLDVKLLKELLLDGRKSFVQLSQDLGVSKDVVMEHYKKLSQQGIIVGATIQFNYRHFGYEAVSTILARTDSNNFKDVFDRLSGLPGINPRRGYLSNYNLSIVATLKKIEDLSNLKENLRRQTQMNTLNTYIWTDIRNTPENLTLDTAEETRSGSFVPKRLPEKTVDIDEVDLQIINELQKDGRASFSCISKKIGIAVDTASRRYTKLRDNGSINVSIQFNPLLVGYTAVAYFFISFSSFAENLSAIDRLSVIPDVSYIAKISGDYDLIVAVLSKDIVSLVRVNEQISEAANISKLEVHLVGVPEVWPPQLQYISTF